MRYIAILLCIVCFADLASAQNQWVLTTVGDCPAGQAIQGTNVDGSANCIAIGGGSIPSGLITFVVSGTCPSGWTEVTGLAGRTLFGTLAANGDVGTTGGSDTVTASGTVSAPTFTGNALAGHAHTFTGSLLATHTHTAGTLSAAAQTFTGSSTTVPAETVNSLTAAAQTVNSMTAAAQTITWPAGVPTQAADTFTTTKFTTSGSGTAAFVTESARGAISWPAGVPTNGTSAVTGTMNSSAVTGTLNSTTLTPLGGNASSAVSGASDATSGGTPAGTLDSVSGGTPSGSVSAPTFTGASAENRSSYVKVIFCSKT